MLLRIVDDRLRGLHRWVVPDLVRPHRGAVANALAAVHRDRVAAAQRAAAQEPGDLESALRMLAVGGVAQAS
jgi:hypothetical protein